MKSYYVYILECEDGSYYTGITNDPERRLQEHQRGGKEYSYTASRLPVKMIYIEKFRYVDRAIAREKQIKKWSRKKKEALTAQNYHLLKEISNINKVERIAHRQASAPAHIASSAQPDN